MKEEVSTEAVTEAATQVNQAAETLANTTEGSADVVDAINNNSEAIANAAEALSKNADVFSEVGAEQLGAGVLNEALGMAIIPGIVGTVLFVLLFVSLWKVFTKAGQPGWTSLIPLFNILILLKIVNKPLWWFLLLFVPIVNLVIFFIIYDRLSKSFGKGIGYTLGLLFFGYIFLPLLAFGSAEYKALD